MPVLVARHVTTYRYRKPVGFGEHRMMFRPRESADQRLIGVDLRIDPEPVNVRWFHDVFGNWVGIARFDKPASELRFDSTVRVLHALFGLSDVEVDEYARHYPFAYTGLELPDLARCRERQYPDDREVEAWARQFVLNGRPTNVCHLLTTMTYAIQRGFTYLRREEKGIQDPMSTLALGSGTCRDFAIFMIEAVRSLGFAARFVSGYIHVPSGGSRNGRPAIHGGGATHAWLQVYLPGPGWVDFDPTNGIVGNRGLIRVAAVHEPEQAVPLAGTWTGAAADYLDMTVAVTVTQEEPQRRQEAS